MKIGAQLCVCPKNDVVSFQKTVQAYRSVMHIFIDGAARFINQSDSVVHVFLFDPEKSEENNRERRTVNKRLNSTSASHSSASQMNGSFCQCIIIAHT